MTDDVIRLNLPRPSSVWYEKLSYKEQSLPDHKRSANYESVCISPSGRLVFFQYYSQLMALDTLCGVPTKLRAVNLAYDPITSYQFHPLSDKEGIVFRKTTTQGQGVELEVAKFGLDLVRGRLNQLTNWSHLLNLFSLYEIAPLQIGQSVLVHGQQLDKKFMTGRPEKFLAELDLHEMKFTKNVASYRNQLYDQREFLTFNTSFQGQFYGFLYVGTKKLQMDNFDFTFIARIDPTQNKRATELLTNHHECFNRQLNGQKASQLDGTWHGQYFYLHITVQQPPNRITPIPHFQHYFVRLDILTFKWSALKFANDGLSSRVPLKMTLSPKHNILLLIETSNGRTVYAKNVKDWDLLRQNEFYANGGHLHARMWRLPMSQPEPLKHIALSALNRFNPEWKVDKPPRLPPTSTIQLLFRVDPRQCRAVNNFGGNLQGLRCIDCGKRSSSAHRFAATRFLPDYLQKHPKTLLERENLIRFLWAFLPISFISIVFYLVYKFLLLDDGGFKY